MEGLSALSKFLGVYEDFQGLVKAYGLKWAVGSAEELLIARMNKTVEDGDVLKWIGEVKAAFADLQTFMDFMAISDLRFEEAVNSFNLIIDLSKAEKLSDYYDVEKEALEHYRFKKLFIRRTKKAFVSFIPKAFIERVSRESKVTKSMIYNRLQKRGFKLRFGDVREYYATFMTRLLNPAEIDFLQGRVSASVFMRNYFNPALIADLKDRVFQGIAEIQKRIC